MLVSFSAVALLSILQALPFVVALPNTRPHKVIVDQDCSGPATTNSLSVLGLVNARADVDVLGITIVVGDVWAEEAANHCLRMLELIGRTSVPVYMGAKLPLSNSPQEVTQWMATQNVSFWSGAYATNQSAAHYPEGLPKLLVPSQTPAAEFIVSKLRQHPGEVTVLALGPLTNIATAMLLDPQVPQLAQGLVTMAGALDCSSAGCDDPKLPKHEFNLWFDPEAAARVLTVVPGVSPGWQHVLLFTMDSVIPVRWTTGGLLQRIQEHKQDISPSQKYLLDYIGADALNFPMFDEVAVGGFIADDVVAKVEEMYIGVDTSQQRSRGELLTHRAAGMSRRQRDILERQGLQKCSVVTAVNLQLFYDVFFRLVVGPAVTTQLASGV